MDDRMIDAFDDCVRALEAGASLEDCLAKYPDLAEELGPRLKTVLMAQNSFGTIQPSPESQSNGRQRFLAQAADLRNDRQAISVLPSNGSHSHASIPIRRSQPNALSSLVSSFAWLLRPFASTAVRVVAILAVALVAGASALGASAQSLPGSPLYPLKRTIEDTQLALAANSASRVQLQNEFSERRMQELQQVTGRGLSVAVEFGGQLTRLSPTQWTIDGITVTVPAGISISGVPDDGLYVWVEGETRPDHSVVAKQVKVEGIRFQGKVVSIKPGVWQIDSWSVFTGNDTHIEDNPKLGDQVDVNVWVLPDGSWLAEQIRLLSRAAPSEDENPLRPTDDHGSNAPSPTEDHGGSQSNPSEGHGGSSSPTAAFTPMPTREDHSGNGSSNTAQPALASSTPTPTSSSQGGKGPSPSNTPQSTNSSGGGSGGGNGGGSSGGGGSGKTPEPSKTPEPTHHD